MYRRKWAYHSKLRFLSPICSRKGAYPPKTRHGERMDSKSKLISDYLRCKKQKIQRYGTFKSLTGCILKHMIRLISSHDYKVEQKMTALFLATQFALGNEENINDSVNFGCLLRSRKWFMFSPVLIAFVLLLKLIFHRKQGSFVKTRWPRSLYMERKMTILWHMIMSHTRGKGAYMFSTKCDGSLYVI